jgi:hypothetical protein
LHVRAEVREGNPFPFAHFCGIGRNRAVMRAGEDMHDLVFDEIVRHGGSVMRGEQRREGALHPHLLAQAAVHGRKRRFVRPWMAATGIRPLSGGVIFSGGAPLQ